MQYQLAPTAANCWAFRTMCSGLGAERTYTNIIRAASPSWNELDTYGEEECHLYLSAKSAEEVNRFFDEYDDRRLMSPHLNNIRGISLDLRNTAPEYVNFGYGAALLRQTEAVKEVLKAISEKTKMPLSVQLCLGNSENYYREKRILRLLEELQKLELPMFHEIIVELRHAESGEFHEEIVPEIQKVWTKKITLLADYSDNKLPKTIVNGFLIGEPAIKDPMLFARLLNNAVRPEMAVMEYGRACRQHAPKPSVADYISANCGIFQNMFKR
ncbi:MAG: hypothetical protein ACE5DM_00325 [Candidatus Nanoarchaeia archaeon]